MQDGVVDVRQQEHTQLEEYCLSHALAWRVSYDLRFIWLVSI